MAWVNPASSGCPLWTRLGLSEQSTEVLLPESRAGTMRDLDRQLSTAGFAEGKGQPGREGAQHWVCKPELDGQVDRDVPRGLSGLTAGGLMAEGGQSRWVSRTGTW